MKKHLQRALVFICFFVAFQSIPNTVYAAAGAWFCNETAPYDNDGVDPGTSFTKGWKLKNSGTTTWTNSYCLRYVSDNLPSGTLSTSQNAVCVQGTVRPGTSYWFNVPMLSPASGTGLREDWKFTGPTANNLIQIKGTNSCTSVNGNTFNSVWIKINVNNVSPVLSGPSVSPATGVQQSTSFTWEVRYQDSNGEAPAQRDVIILNPVSGQWYNFAMNAAGGSYAMGMRYTHTATLQDVGQYRYKFQFSDGVNAPVTTATYNGPQTSAANSPPTCTLASPSNGATGQSLNLTLSWSGSDPNGDSITNYYVELATNSGFTSPIWSQWMGNSLTSWQPSASGVNLNYNTTYYWRVGAYDGKDVGNFSSSRSFTTQAAPNSPPTSTLVSPSNGATEQSLNLTLSWSGSDPNGDSITNYYVELATNSGFTSPIWSQWMGNALTSWRPSASGVNLSYSTTYYWRVRAYDGKDVGNFSSSRSFTTQAPPNNPPNACTLMSPLDGAAGQTPSVTLSWGCTDPDPGDTIVNYFVAIDNDANFGSPLWSNWMGGNSTSWQPQSSGVNLAYNTTYYWYVYGNDGNASGASSSTWRFTTGAPPNQPPILTNASVTPLSGVKNSTTFAWQVLYTDADGDAPVNAQISIRNPETGQWWTFLMTAGAGSYGSGKTYTYSQMLIGNGLYQYKFIFSDGVNPAVSSSVYNGPTTGTSSTEAGFAGETISDGTRFSPRQSFTKTWTLRNVGSVAWDNTFFLRRRAVTVPLSVVTAIPVSGVIPAGGNFTFSVNMQAPAVAGNYREEWEFVSPDGGIIPVRALDGSWTVNSISAVIRVDITNHPPDGLPPADNGNRGFGAINDKIIALAEQNDIPPIVLQAIAYQESGWQQYWPSDLGVVSYCNGTQKYDRLKGKAKLNFNVDANCVFQSVDIGLMQYSVPLSAQMSDITKIQYASESAAALAQEVSGSWEKNLESAVQKLNTKWALSEYGSDCDKDKSILENWYYAIAWYNGEGSRAYNYVGNVYDYMSGGSSMGQTLDSLVTKVGDISSPRIIPGFTTTIVTQPSAIGEVYTLLEIANLSGRIHRWTGGNNYVDITEKVKNSTCMAAAGQTVKPPSKVVGVKVSQSGNQVTISWRQNPQDEDVAGYYVLWEPTDESGKPIIGAVQRSNMIAGASSTSWVSQFNPGNYRVSVFASGSLSDGLPSDGVLFMVANAGTRPGVVTNVKATVSGRDVKVTWDAILNASYYNLSWKKEGEATFKGVAGINGTEYRVANIPDGSFVIKMTACHKESVLWIFTSKVECGDQSSEIRFSIPEPGFAISCTQLHNNDDPLEQSISVNELKHYCFTLPSDVKVLTVQMGGKGLHDDPQDADLYVKSGSPVVAGDLGKKNDQINPVLISPWLDGSLESVTVYDIPTAGKWYVAVHGSADMNDIKSLNFFIKLHYHGAGREGVPDGFELNPTGVSKIFAPVDPDAGSWWSYETKCADKDYDEDPVSGACSPAVTIDGTSGNGVVTPANTCYKDCRSSAHKYGDWDTLDFNLPDDADKGEDLFATFSGTVIFKGSNNGWGDEVVIQSDIDSNFAVRYAHMASWEKGLESGQYVRAGQKIGTIGKSGGTPYNHLHLSLHKNLVMNLASGQAMDKAALKADLKGSRPASSYYSASIPLVISDYLAVPQEQRETVVQSKCPVNIDVVDDQERRVGPGAFGTLNMDIPGGEYVKIHAANRDFEEISLPDTGSKDYRFNIAGNDEGEFNIAVSAPDGAKKLYNNVVYTHEPVDESTFAELDLSKLATNYPLVINDGTNSFIPEPSSSTENAQQFVNARPVIADLSSRTLATGDVLTIRGTGFGNPGDDSPGEIEIMHGHDLYRPFDIETWSDTEITAKLSGENVEMGRYRLRLKIYPSRVSSNKKTVDIITSDSTPVLQSARPVFVLENQTGIAADFLGKGFAAGAQVTVGGGPVGNIYVAGADHIQGTLPALNAGSHAVVVDNNNGKQSAGSVTVEALPLAGDFDQDGLSNENEFRLGLKPDISDSDDDGMSDGADAFPGDPSETKDSDSDGIGDNEDVCPQDPAKITSPGVCGCGVPDTDSDNDTILDCNDQCASDPAKIQPGVCGCGVADIDFDNDGTFDCNDLCPDDPAKIAAGQCGCGVVDRDSDSDGIADCNDQCSNDPLKVAQGACGCGVADIDSDADGTLDCNDLCPNDLFKIAAGQCGCGVADTDSDNDATADCNDGCVNDPLKTAQGVCGCGIADVDSDNDGTPDCKDACPADAAKIAAGICGCGVADTDSDNDATADCKDGCPADGAKVAAGICGCGVADIDSDADGTLDCNDLCPNDLSKIAAGQCGCGVADIDSDNDGTVDCKDGCPADAAKVVSGVCGCGVADTDSDNDGTADCKDQCVSDAGKAEPGICGCGTPDIDTDGDAVPDCNDLCPGDPLKTAQGACGCGVADIDSDNDGTVDCKDACPADATKIAAGICGCGVADTDSDNDATADCKDGCPADGAKVAAGICGCGVADIDSDADGTLDCNDLCPNDLSKIAAGQCGCGVADIDSDNDGTVDCKDGCPADGAKVAAGICGCGVADDNNATYYADDDGDGFGDPANLVEACSQPQGYAANRADCDDSKGDVYPQAAEACNGIDDDCDVDVDEGLGQTSCGVGICTHTVDNCIGGVSQACDPMEGAGPEACEGRLDENCDGSVDEGCECTDGNTRPCGVSVGECSEGVQTCVFGRWGDCAGVLWPQAEVCNGMDDDCNGIIDDGFPVGDICDGDDGDLCRNGAFACMEDGSGVECAAEDPADVAEVCEGSLDENCDGNVDEGCECVDGSSMPCGSGIGECREGVQVCAVGRWGVCVGEVRPIPEVCDGLDNDCSGEIDDGVDTDGDGEPDICDSDDDGDSIPDSQDRYPVEPNRAPAIDSLPDQSVDEGRPVLFVVVGSDPDGDEVEYRAEGLPAGAAFKPEGGVFEWAPSFDQAGAYDMRFVASDGYLEGALAVRVVVAGVNRPPVIDIVASGIANRSVSVDEKISLFIQADDPDGDNIVYKAVGIPVGASLDGLSGYFEWTPGKDEVGQNRISFEASDGELSDRAGMTVIVVGAKVEQGEGGGVDEPSAGGTDTAPTESGEPETTQGQAGGDTPVTDDGGSGTAQDGTVQDASRADLPNRFVTFGGCALIPRR